jgi:hypothetical protein
MSGRKLKKGKLKSKRISNLIDFSTDLDLIIKMMTSYFKDLIAEEKPPSMTGCTVRFKRLKSLSNDFFGGIDPPPGLINPDYKQQPSNPRKCLECGKTHDTIVENTMTGERLEELNKCKDCMLFGSIRKLERPETPPALKEWEDGVIAEWGGTARCMTSDGRNVNMAEELTRLEKELIKHD